MEPDKTGRCLCKRLECPAIICLVVKLDKIFGNHKTFCKKTLINIQKGSRIIKTAKFAFIATSIRLAPTFLSQRGRKAHF